MADQVITAELLLRTDMQEAVRDIEKGLSKATKTAANDARKQVSEAWRDAIGHALTEGRTGDAIKSLLTSGVVDAAEKYQSLMRQGRKEEAAQQKKLLDERSKAYKRELDIMSKAAKEQRGAAAQMGESLEGGAEKLRGLFSGGDLFGQFARAAKGGGQRLARAGEGRVAGAKDLMAKGGDPKMVAQMAKMGRTMAAIGTALATVAAVVGAVVVLVKLFADLESKVKDMNKALIDSAGAADFGLGHAEITGGKLTERLKEIRNETTAVNRNFMRFRVGAKEQQQILAQLSQAGFTYRKMNEEIQKGSKFMKSYSDATALAITYSRVLGVSTGEMASKMGEFTLETGMGLEEISEQFSVIAREAALAGFTTKRFYATIVEVTSGMAFYGVRIDETTKLLKSFDSLLGETVGAEAFKRLVGQYKDKGAQDRIRDLILKDQEFAQEQFAAAFERQVRSLAKTGDKLGLSEDDIRELLQMDEVQMSARLQELGAGPEQIQDFRRASMVGRAAGGDLGAMTRAMPFAGPGFDIAMASQATEVFGGKRVDEVLRDLAAGSAGAAELAALEQVTGKSLDELEKLSSAFTNMEAALENMRKIAEVEPHLRSKEQKDLLARYGKELGLFINEQTGELVKGEADEAGRMLPGTGVVIKDALQAVTETTTLGEDQIKEQLTKDQEIATEISHNITGLNEIIEQSTNRILERIYEAVMVIVEFLSWGDEDKERRRAQIDGAHRAQEEAQEEAEKARKDLQAAQSAVADARQKGDDDALAAAQENLKAAETQSITAEKNLRETTTMTQAVSNLSNEARGGMGLGAKEILEARERAGEVDLGPGGAKTMASELDRALYRQQTKMAVLEPSTWSVSNFSDEIVNEVGAMRTDLEDLSGDTRDRLLASPVLDQVEAGSIGEAIAKGEAAYKKAEEEAGFYIGVDEKQAMIEAFNAAVAQHLTASVLSPEEQKMQADERKKQLDDLIGQMEQNNWASAVGHLFGGAKKTQDMIIPAGGGRPVITDERDTMMAFKPGGPIAAAMGGGGGGPVSVNIYGGDQKKVYDTVMRALRATGNA
jgi:hypothetical protein